MTFLGKIWRAVYPVLLYLALQIFFIAAVSFISGILQVYEDNKKEKGRDEDSAQRAIIATMALCKLDNTQGVDLWENIYSTTSFFVGEVSNL